jgi:argininosuccinate synthase
MPGFDEEELKVIEERAGELGSAKHANPNYCRQILMIKHINLIYGNVCKTILILSSVSAERVFQAIEAIVAQPAQQLLRHGR